MAETDVVAEVSYDEPIALRSAMEITTFDLNEIERVPLDTLDYRLHPAMLPALSDALGALVVAVIFSTRPDERDHRLAAHSLYCAQQALRVAASVADGLPL